ncbi:hypothetical protein CRUP_000314, partial [Coryphaenoides rupestris]
DTLLHPEDTPLHPEDTLLHPEDTLLHPEDTPLHPEDSREMNRPAVNGGLATMTLEVLLSPELLQRVKVEFS